MSALTAIADQLTLLNSRIGEPADGSTGRWTATEKLAALIASRREVAEETRCFPVKDSLTMTAALLPAAGSPCLISVTNDFFDFEELEYNGLPLDIVRPQDWRFTVGQDDTLQGIPSVAMYFGRKFQLFRVPAVAGQVFRYRGWAYPADIVSEGVDASFTDRAADVAIWHCAMALKGSDERNNNHEQMMTDRGLRALKAQYWPKGARYVRSGGD